MNVKRKLRFDIEELDALNKARQHNDALPAYQEEQVDNVWL